MTDAAAGKTNNIYWVILLYIWAFTFCFREHVLKAFEWWTTK